MSNYLSKYQTYEKFANSQSTSTDNANNNTIKCYSCVGNWPNRKCYPEYDSNKCGNGTFEDYQSCAQTCGTNMNRPVGVNPMTQTNTKTQTKAANDAANAKNNVSNDTLNNKINKALNNKLKNKPSFKPNNTNSDLFDHLNTLYHNYVKSMPYDVPKTFSFSIFLSMVVIFTVCNLVLTFYGAKSIGACSNKHVSMTIFTALFLIFSWIGNFFPYYGNFASLISMVVTTVLVLVTGPVCKR
jgi:hypothetical protein